MLGYLLLGYLNATLFWSIHLPSCKQNNKLLYAYNCFLKALLPCASEIFQSLLYPHGKRGAKLCSLVPLTDRSLARDWKELTQCLPCRSITKWAATHSHSDFALCKTRSLQVTCPEEPINWHTRLKPHVYDHTHNWCMLFEMMQEPCSSGRSAKVMLWWLTPQSK